MVSENNVFESILYELHLLRILKIHTWFQMQDLLAVPILYTKNETLIEVISSEWAQMEPRE